MIEFIRILSLVAIPSFIIFVLGYGHIKKVNVYETFIEGAKGRFNYCWYEFSPIWWPCL